MIATLEGKLAHASAESLIVLVGAVGIEVTAPFSTTEKLGGERVFLYTRLVVREDSLTVYGFASVGEREIFDAVLKISGIGPRLAIAMLSTLSVDNIRSAAVNERPEVISRVPGIGKKTAQKVVLELQDKFPASLDSLPDASEDESAAEVMDYLTGLGFSVIEAQTAVQAIPRNAPDSVEDRVRIALQMLGG